MDERIKRVEAAIVETVRRFEPMSPYGWRLRRGGRDWCHRRVRVHLLRGRKEEGRTSVMTDFDELLQRSSLADDQLWVQCAAHGRQPTDPFVGGRRCVLCVAEREGVSTRLDCANCGEPMNVHCTAHVIPCCPFKCDIELSEETE